MTQGQYKKAVELNERIDKLEKVKEMLKDSSLWYAFKTKSFRINDWELFAEFYMRPIRHILDKYDKMIRQEINDEIKMLKSKIEEI